MDRKTTSPDTPDFAAKIVELEQKLTFQQRMVDELNGVVLSQQGELERMMQESAALRKLIEGLIDRGVGEDLPHEKPPHY